MKAKIQARVYSAPKTRLQDVVPLETPFSVHVDICSFCNFKCKFCFQSDEEAIRKKGLQLGMMDFELFAKLVDDLTAFPQKHKKVKIGLHGEPTLHPDLPKMIAYLHAREVTEIIEVFTNGSLLNPQLNRSMIEAGLSRINISVEAMDRRRYKEITGVPVDMERFVANIRNLYDVRGECKIYIKIVDDDLSEAEKELFYETYGNICDEIFIENVVPQWAEANRFEMETTGMYGQTVKRYKEVCPFIFMYLHFNWDGTASACTLDWGKEVLVGDIRRESAIDIWNGKALKRLQRAHLQKKRGEIPFCRKCLAPMLCCLEDLDDDADELLKRIDR